jgi:hypothetical protein
MKNPVGAESMFQKLDKLRAAVRKRIGRFRSVVLLYHRVADLETDPWALAVSPRHFAEHLEVLRRSRVVLTLDELSGRSMRGDDPSTAVAISFDDGYADNLHCARTLLECHEFPATVFLATGNLGCQREFWWDELDRLLLQPGTLPSALELNIGDRQYCWQLREDASYGVPVARRRGTWRTWHRAPGRRQQLYRRLWRLLQPLLASERQQSGDTVRLPIRAIVRRDDGARSDKRVSLGLFNHARRHPADLGSVAAAAGGGSRL